MVSKKIYSVICESCGERYSLGNFSKEDPLEVCGECGCETFLPYSRNCYKGYVNLEHYLGLLELLPLHLRSNLPRELLPRRIPLTS